MGYERQQIRAVELAHAIASDLVDKKGKDTSINKLAVVGGGVAGATFVVALIKRLEAFRRKKDNSLRLPKIFLYEYNTEILSAHSHASHRFLHPGYNLWCKKNANNVKILPFRSHTNLPYLNWFPGWADEIEKDLRDQFYQTLHAHRYVLNVQFGKEVIGYCIKKDKDQATLEIKDLRIRGEKVATSDPFDAIIFATGPGEVKARRFASYWSTSCCEQQYLPLDRIISGIGDGGKIEACYQVFGSELWELIMFYLAEFRQPDWNDPFSPKIKDLTDAEAKLNRILSSEDVQNSSANEAAKIIHNEFERDFCKVLNKIRIDLNRLRERTPRVILLGIKTNPFTSKSASMNNLLLAHLMSARLIEYVHAPDGFDEAMPDGQIIYLRHGGIAPISEIAPVWSEQKKTRIEEDGLHATFADIELSCDILDFFAHEEELYSEALKFAQKFVSLIEDFPGNYCAQKQSVKLDQNVIKIGIDIDAIKNDRKLNGILTMMAELPREFLGVGVEYYNKSNPTDRVNI